MNQSPHASLAGLNRAVLSGLTALAVFAAACAPAAPAGQPTAAPAKPTTAPAAAPTTAPKPAAAPTTAAKPAEASKPAAALPAADPNQQALQFRMATVLGEVTPFVPAERKFVRLINERTGGKIQIEHFCCTQLGGERELSDGVKLGTIGIATVGATGYEKFDLTFMPFMFRDSDHLLKAMNGPIGDRWAEDFYKDRGVRLLGYSFRATRNFLTKRKVSSPEDLRGMKIRAPEIPVITSSLRALGANPVVIAYPELYTSLQQGTADGWEGPVDVMVNDKHWEVAKYLNMNRWIQTVGFTMINDDVWQKLTPTTQTIFKQTWNEVAKDLETELNRIESDYVATLQKNGIEVIDAGDKPFRDATAEVWKEFAPRVWGQGVYEQIQAVR